MSGIPTIPPVTVLYMASFPAEPAIIPSQVSTGQAWYCPLQCSLCGRAGVPLISAAHGRICQSCAVQAVRAFEAAKREIEESAKP